MTGCEMAEDVADPREPKWWLYVKMFKAGLEILAIIVAGVWAFFAFWHDNLPLDKLLDTSSALDFSNHTANGCEMEYTVSFKNISKHRITIAKSRVRAWYMTRPETPTEATPVVYLSPLDSLDGVAIFDSDKILDKYKRPLFRRLTGVFGPSEGDTEGFTFFVKQAPDRQILLMTELWSDDDIKKVDYLKHPTWQDYRREWLCVRSETAK